MFTKRINKAFLGHLLKGNMGSNKGLMPKLKYMASLCSQVLPRGSLFPPHNPCVYPLDQNYPRPPQGLLLLTCTLYLEVYLEAGALSYAALPRDTPLR